MSSAAVQMSGLTSMSISRIAREWGIDRRTVSNIISGIKPGDKTGANPKWYIRDVAPALVQYTSGGGVSHGSDDDDDFDPKALMPADRKAWYESESKRLAVEKELGQLIQDSVFEDVLANTFKQLKATLVTLPDVLERDADMTPKQVAKAEKVIDAAMAQLYKSLVDDSEFND